MVQPKAQVEPYSLAKQVLALVLSFLILEGAFPPLTAGAPLPAPRADHFRPLPLAVASPAMPAEPTPAPEPPQPPAQPSENKEWGEISIGQPKVWQFERVSSLLDGLLRDVQGVSMNDLIALDPNATNGAAVKFVQSMLEIGVQYNQANAASNTIAQQTYQASLANTNQQIQANNAYLQQLYQERQSLTAQLLPAIQANTTLQTQLSTNPPTGEALTALQAQAAAASSLMTGLQSQLTAVNTQITTASSGPQLPAAPNLTATSGPTLPGAATNTLGTFLGSLPSGIQTDVVNQLQSPSFPATKKLDNFITLLYERMAREISVLQDDVMRDTENVPFLVQFDVGLYPSKEAKDHVGVVEFTMNCDGCKVYSLYPGQSSYNIASYHGSSQSFGFLGALQTLFGFGLNADYRRQTDTLQGDLVQSVYMAGFQEGAESLDRTNVVRRQRFGWYYGASPIEKMVSPGIRSTFAVISVPRNFLTACSKQSDKPPLNGVTKCQNAEPARDIEWCRTDEMDLGHHPAGRRGAQPLCAMEIQSDSMGVQTVKLNLTAHADWVPRENPGASWWSFSDLGLGSNAHGITRYVKAVLPGTDYLKLIPDIVQKERERLHVLGMEYNPVYYTPPSQSSAGQNSNMSSTPPPPGSATASATGGGSGTTTVTVSGAGSATATSSGTTSSTATASATNPSTAPSSSNAATIDPLTGCKQGMCAAVLIRLAETLDPNLVVSVKGLPLRRVRDWRGRATSVLPAAQSDSDLISPSTVPAAGSTTPPGRPIGGQNAAAASLFEVDAPGPDTWMQVDSHRILLNVSRDLAGDREEFPSIQIADPTRRALFVPMDLDTGFSELVMNGFHFPTRDGTQFGEYLCDHLRLDPEKCQAASNSSDEKNLNVKLHPAGPYAYETFLPLFLPKRDEQPIYAYLGETGAQILIGFDKLNVSSAMSSTPSKPKSWLAGRTQVILEDRYLDLAWSLSCYPQGSMLVCDVPVRELQDAYSLVREICKSQHCPSVPGTLSLGDDTSTEPLSISTLQVWVDQYDPDDQDSFHSGVPAIFGRFPLERNADDRSRSGPDIGYRPWSFESATPNWVKLTGCNYPEFETKQDQAKDQETGKPITILGRNIPQPFRTQILRPGVESGCKWFVIPTTSLTNPVAVVEYPEVKEIQTSKAKQAPFTTDPDPCIAKSAAACAPESLSTVLFSPSFERAVALPQFSSGTSTTPRTIDHWKIDILTSHVDCDDLLNLPDAYSKFKATWKVGPTRIPVRQPGESAIEHLVTDPVPPACQDRLQTLKSAAEAGKKTADDKEDAAKKALANAEAKANAAKGKTGAEAIQAAAAAAQAKKQAEAATAAASDAETASSVASAMAAVAGGVASVAIWDEASKNVQIVLELEVDRINLADLPLNKDIRILRGPLLSSVGNLPDLGPSFLPTQLAVVPLGNNQFALQGDHAGVIDAVMVQGPDGTTKTIQTVAGGQVATVTLTDSKDATGQTAAAPTISGFDTNTVPVGTRVEIRGSNFGADAGTLKFGTVTARIDKNCWTSSSITVDVPSGTPTGPVELSITTNGKTGKRYQNLATFTVAAKPLDRAEPTSCPATGAGSLQGGSNNSGGASGPKAGAYSILPLIAVSQINGKPQYLPLDVVDQNGKPLSFTVTEQKAASTTTPKGVDSPTTTLTISKKTTVTPAPSTSNTTPSQ